MAGIEDEDGELVDSGGGPAPGAVPAPLRPEPPRPERLGRNAALIAAAVLGMAALVAVVFLSPAHSGGSRGVGNARERAPAAAPPPSFMDRPVPGVAPAPIAPRVAAGVTADTVGQAARAALGPAGGQTAGDGAIYTSPRRETGGRPDSVDDYRKALASDLGVVSVAGAVERGGERPNGESAVVSYGESAPAAQGAGPGARPIGGGVGVAPGESRSMPARPIEAVRVSARASAGYVLAAGSVVPVVLLTALTSDIAGDCVAQLSRDVYDSRSESVVLIPKGAKLLGHLASSVVHGQSRVALAWVRIDLPDGRVIDLPSQPATDAAGGAGVPADVDNHVFRTFGAAGIAAALGAGVQLSQPTGSGTVYAAPSVGQVMAGSLGQELGTVGLEVVRRELDVPPTLTVAAGAEFNLLLTTDLVFGEGYRDRGR